MDFSFFSKEIEEVLNNIDLSKITEIRVRVNQYLLCKFENKICFISKKGLTEKNEDLFLMLQKDIDKIINILTEYSIYAFNDYICNGFLVWKDGQRIGITGECVYDNNKLIAMKNISSLNIRIPHNIDNCADKVLKKIFKNDEICNSLIISPPGIGKTTFLKDIIRKISREMKYNLFVCDEKGELLANENLNVDYIKYSNKRDAVKIGIRNFSPDIIIMDEIFYKNDFRYVNEALKCGVRVIATIHGNSIKDIERRKGFEKNLFDKFFILKKNHVNNDVDFEEV